VVDRRERSLPPADCALAEILVRQPEPLLDEVRRHLTRRPEFAKLGEDQCDRLSDRLISCEDDLAVAVIGEPDGQLRAELAAPGGLPQATCQAGTDQVQLDLAHRPLEAQQQPVIEDARMVEPIAIADQRIDQRAQVQQVVPIAVVPGQPRDLDGQHHADAAQADLGDEPVKTGPSDARAADAEIVIDDPNVAALPAELHSTVSQTVLAVRRSWPVRDMLRLSCSVARAARAVGTPVAAGTSRIRRASTSASAAREPVR
jgi:hypothetical protein